MLCAFVVRDVLWLRSLLVGAQGLLALYGLGMGVPSIAAWNALFLAINGTWTLRIMRERRTVALPPALEPIYVRHFAALTPPEFLRLWRQGRRVTFRDERLTRAGVFPEALFWLTAGTVRVSREGQPIADLSPGSFVAEMSLLTGRPANADAEAVGDVEARCWNVSDLQALRRRDPALWTRIQSVIGLDVVTKLQAPARSGEI
jgi:hypothetical protein